MSINMNQARGKNPRAICLFEQSGTFKNEFIKLGYDAYDYDICNDYGQTDVIIDLFNEINKAYEEQSSIFDIFNSHDIIMAFFPCERFEAQIIMHMIAKANGERKRSPIKKLENSMRLQQELSRNYMLISKLMIICYKRNLKLIFENPYCEQHYLKRYFPIEPTIIDYNRRDRGDYYIKPTQYWFVNIEPRNNFIFEGIELPPRRKNYIETKVSRSEISPQYANRFIREFIIKEEE